MLAQGGPVEGTLGGPQLAEHDGLEEVPGDHDRGLFGCEHRVRRSDLLTVLKPRLADETQNSGVELLRLFGKRRVSPRLNDDGSDDAAALQVEVEQHVQLLRDHGLETGRCPRCGSNSSPSRASTSPYTRRRRCSSSASLDSTRP